MSIDEVIAVLDKNDEVMESYVLLREIKLCLDVGDDFHPFIKVKIYKSSAIKPAYHFSVSHYVHTPDQVAPYITSRPYADSEEAAIQQAISTTTSFIKTAIKAGHEPSESWLVPNDNDF